MLLQYLAYLRALLALVHVLAGADLPCVAAHSLALQHPGGAAKIMLAGERAAQRHQSLCWGSMAATRYHLRAEAAAVRCGLRWQ